MQRGVDDVFASGELERFDLRLCAQCVGNKHQFAAELVFELGQRRIGVVFWGGINAADNLLAVEFDFLRGGGDDFFNNGVEGLAQLGELGNLANIGAVFD